MEINLMLVKNYKASIFFNRKPKEKQCLIAWGKKYLNNYFFRNKNIENTLNYNVLVYYAVYD